MHSAGELREDFETTDSRNLIGRIHNAVQVEIFTAYYDLLPVYMVHYEPRVLWPHS